MAIDRSLYRHLPARRQFRARFLRQTQNRRLVDRVRGCPKCQGRSLVASFRVQIASTYRLRLSKQFTFDGAAACAGYLSSLGVARVYCSPILQAARGSSHGCDVVDPTRVNGDLGGEVGFRRLVAALREQGLELMVDIVPNHMATTGRENAWWWDLLRNGPSSRHANYFDVDWASPISA